MAPRVPLFILLLVALAVLPANAGWSSPFESGFDGPVFDLMVFDDRLIAAGAFSSVDGMPVRNIAAFDGESWAPLANGVGVTGRNDPGNSWVEVLLIHQGDLIAGGKFDEAGEEPALFVARWDGAAWHAIADGLEARVSALASVNQNLFVAGYFQNADELELNYITRFNGRFFKLGQGMSSPVATLEYHEGRLYAGGFFGKADGIPAGTLAYWVDNAWHGITPGLASGDGEPTAVFDLFDFQGDLYVGGHFHRSGTSKAAAITRRSDGEWLPVASGFETVGAITAVHELIEYRGELVAVGTLGYSADVELDNIARLRWGKWRAVGGGTDDEIKCAEEFQGRLYVGGHFGGAGGLRSPSLAAWEDGVLPELIASPSIERREGGVELSFGIHAAARFSTARVWRAIIGKSDATLVAEFSASGSFGPHFDDGVPHGAFEYWVEFQPDEAPSYESRRLVVAATTPPPRTSLRLAGANPVPGSGEFLVDVETAGELQLRLHDARGRVLRAWDLRAPYGRLIRIPWDGMDGQGRRLARGVYHLRLEFEGASSTAVERTLKFTLAR